MQQFIPFEDEWDMLDATRLEALTPYRVGLALAAQSTLPSLPSIVSASPVRASIRLVVPADSSST
ncbi:MAG: hypothetical protein RSP_26210 [Rhodanobacter sp.]